MKVENQDSLNNVYIYPVWMDETIVYDQEKNIIENVKP